MSLYRKFHGDSCGKDWVRVYSLYEASRKADSFESPRPVKMCIEQRIIEYEYLPQGQLLAHRLFKALIFRNRRGAARLIQLLERVGQSLAQLHHSMQLPESDTMELDFSGTEGLPSATVRAITQTLDNAPSLPFHGDFGTGNIWISNRDERPVIFDPVPSRFCPDASSTKASVYYDIGHMVSSLWCVYPIWLYPFVNSRVIEKCIAAFVKGYEAEAGFQLERSTVLAMALYVTDAYVRQLGSSMNGIRGTLQRSFFRRRRKALLEEVVL